MCDHMTSFKSSCNSLTVSTPTIWTAAAVNMLRCKNTAAKRLAFATAYIKWFHVEYLLSIFTDDYYTIQSRWQVKKPYGSCKLLAKLNSHLPLSGYCHETIKGQPHPHILISVLFACHAIATLIFILMIFVVLVEVSMQGGLQCTLL